jgi:hypothetical protein
MMFTYMYTIDVLENYSMHAQGSRHRPLSGPPPYLNSSTNPHTKACK